MNTLNVINTKIGNYRWTICALIFFATTINYLDRQVISLLKPYLEEAGLFGEDKTQYDDVYANVVICFQIAYAVGMLLMGKFIDKFGTKMGYAASLLGWSIAAIGHALARGPLGFGIARAALGVPEAGNFPAANKAVSEWFPKKERALATGIYNSGCNIGAIVAPLSVPLMAQVWGWQTTFIVTGAIGLLWLWFWQKLYYSPQTLLEKGILGKGEYDYIHSDKEDQESELQDTKGDKVGWLKLLTYRQTWAFFMGKFLTDPIWWFFLFWLPAFLKEEYGLLGTDVAIPIALVYMMTTVGSIFGGYLPKLFVDQGMDINKARKRSMFIYALFPVTVLFAQYFGAQSMWWAVIIIGIAASAHQAWSANIYTTVSDMFPKKAIASVTGIGGMAGAIGGILIMKMSGVLFTYFRSPEMTSMGYDIKDAYAIMFFICGIAYLTAWSVMHFLVPKFKKIEDL